MADADALDKIRKLMALALRNPNEEEARSAALKAVRLISDHGFAIGRTAPAFATSRSPSPVEPFERSVMAEMLRRSQEQIDQMQERLNREEQTFQQYREELKDAERKRSGWWRKHG